MIEMDTIQLAKLIEKDLIEKYGILLSGDALKRSLGYPSMGALHKAINRELLPIPTFQLKDRRGRFALTKDVANWLAEQRNNAVN